MLTFSLIVNLLFGMVIGWLYQDKALLKRSVMRDELTGLKRAVFLKRFEREYERELKEPKGFWTLLYLDLDGFKKVNDQLGHDAGDRALQELARVISDMFRVTDFFIRLYGDEFLVIARRMESEEAGRRLNALDHSVQGYGERLGVKMGVSGGILKVRKEDQASLADAIVMAEGLMRDNKVARKAGR